MKEKQKPKYNMAQCVGFMLDTAWKTRKRVPFVCLLLAVLQTGQSLLQLFLSPAVLRRVEEGAPLGQLLGAVGFFTLAMLLLNGVFHYVANNAPYARMDVRLRVQERLNHKGSVTSYPNTQDPAFHKLQRTAGETVYTGSYGAAEHIWVTLTDLLKNLLGFGIYLLLLRNLDLRLLLVVMVTAALSFFATRWNRMWINRHREERGEHLKKVGYIRDRAQATDLGKEVRIFGLREWMDDIYTSVFGLFEGFMNRLGMVCFLGSATEVILSAARNGIAYFVLIRMALEGGLSASQFLLYFTAVTGFTSWITGILGQCAALHTECLDLSCVLEYLNWPEPFRFKRGVPIPDGKDGCEFKLEHVSFRYPGAEADTIHDLTLTICPGEKLAVVGLNGAGKTTLVKLLCGFFDPTEGRVLFNGVDVRKFNRQEYYAKFSAVFQEYSQLDVTLAENVAQSIEGIDIARVTDCLDKAGLAEAVSKLPHGLDTHIGREVYSDGVLLSGGQTQRLMLARALYKDGEVLVLDEPTAALDPIAESDMYGKYNEMAAGRTSVYISHRLASTRFCDRIIFLKDGQIAEEGTHEELLALQGGYADLFEVQSRYYREGRDF